MFRRIVTRITTPITRIGFVAAFSAAIYGGFALDATPSAAVTSRIKDIADFEGVRENLLIGYGLVVGLNGTGDRLANSPFTQQSLVSMLERLGVNTRDANLNTRNVAAVMVTAALPPFARHGTHIDISASALGDATNLLGGTLLVTPLLGADGEVYAVAQGQLAVGGFSAQGQSGSSVTKGVPTGARIANGAIVEREIGFELAQLQTVNVTLRNPDFTTARRIAEAINGHFKIEAAQPTDPGTVILGIPETYRNETAALLTEIEQLLVEPDTAARIIVDETSGVIVMGENVRISTVAIANGNLTISISETPQVSQPGPFAPDSAETETVDRSNITVDDGGDKQTAVMTAGVSIQELVSGLNALGIGPRDLINILQAIKAAGALQADIQVM